MRIGLIVLLVISVLSSLLLVVKALIDTDEQIGSVGAEPEAVDVGVGVLVGVEVVVGVEVAVKVGVWANVAV
jgi:hypothetical protein